MVTLLARSLLSRRGAFSGRSRSRRTATDAGAPVRRIAAVAFAAPALDLSDANLPEPVYDAFAVQLGAPIASWLDRARAAIDAADDLEAIDAATLEWASEWPLGPFADRLGDAHSFAHLLGRASVVEEAIEDGVDLGRDFADAGADPDLEFQGAPFSEAIAFLRQKVPLPQKEWSDLVREGHDRAFVVAGNTRVDVAADIKAIVIRTMREGTGLNGFRREFDALIAGGKWTGDPDLADDAGKRAWRARTIFMTNLRSAHAAGRLAQQRALKDVLPFFQYRHAATRTPKRPRPSHLRLDGLTLPQDDPTWGSIYAPNGWMCSCAVRAVTAAAAARVPAPLRTPPNEADVMLAVPEEWRHAPGDSWAQGLIPPRDKGTLAGDGSRRPRQRQTNLKPIKTYAKPFPAGEELPAEETDEEAAERFLARFGADLASPALFRDKAGQALVISRALVEDGRGKLKTTKRGRRENLDRLASTLIDPDEIWVDWSEVTSKQGPTIPRLERTYLRYDPDLAALVGFRWSSEGWVGTTAHHRERNKRPDFDALDSRRHGALLYRRSKGEEDSE